MLLKSINDSFVLAKAKGWKRVYWAIDLHGVIVKSTYDSSIPDTFYPRAIPVLKQLSKRTDICLILFTCSYPDKCDHYIEMFKEIGILFDYVNKNPEIKDNAYSCYESKVYYNVFLEDKAGFDPATDWDVVEEGLKINRPLDID